MGRAAEVILAACGAVGLLFISFVFGEVSLDFANGSLATFIVPLATSAKIGKSNVLTGAAGDSSRVGVLDIRPYRVSDLNNWRAIGSVSRFAIDGRSRYLGELRP
jgi:hypothetical protein